MNLIIAYTNKKANQEKLGNIGHTVLGTVR